jgi:hypothetical protein
LEREIEGKEERANCVSRVALGRWSRWGMGGPWYCPYFNVIVTSRNGSVEAKGNTGINFGHFVRLGHTY